MLDQVYENLLYEEVRHTLVTQYPSFIEVHVQVPKDNGVPEALHGLLKVRQVFQLQRWQVRSNKQGPSKSGDYLVAYHIWTVVACGLNPLPDRPFPRYQPDADLISLALDGHAVEQVMS